MTNRKLKAVDGPDEDEIDVDEPETDAAATVENLSAKDAFPIPEEEAFEEAADDYLDAPEIQTVAEDLIREYADDFGHITNFDVAYRYKRAGGEGGGMRHLGECVKLSGAARHYSRSTNDGKPIDFMIWIAADHCRGRFVLKQMRALVFHELLHIGKSDDEKRKPFLRGHEFEGFEREIAIFGAWQTSLIKIQEAFNEHPLAQQSLLAAVPD